MSEGVTTIEGMDDLATRLEALDAMLGELTAETLDGDLLRAVHDDQLVRALGVAARIGRRAEAIVVESASHVDSRSQAPAASERMTTRLGCRSTNELVQRATRMSSRRAAEVLKAARAVAQPIAPSSGERLPSDFPGMRGALGVGAVGVEGVLAVAGPLGDALRTAGRAAVLAADEELAIAARGEGAEPAPPVDGLRALATVWAMYLDPDGAEPRDAKAMRKRGVTLGVCRDNLVPLRGLVLPEVAAQFQLLCDSILNPKVDGPEPPAGPRFVDAGSEEAMDAVADLRTPAQQRHDAFATMLSKISGSGLVPTIGGAAPTLVVSATAADLDAGRGFAHLDGIDEPVSLAVARHVACTGNVQRVVFGEDGRIIELGSPERIFTHHQRRAIALRDGGCIIPGCHVPAAWCEVHHVVEASRGGPTHTDNGVMVCWHHHRTLDTSGWKIRMRGGVPEVRGPYWWDASMTWRPATKAPTRLRERVARRQ